MANAEAPSMTPTRAAGVRFTKVGKLYYFDFTEHPTLQTGDFVIVETVRGRQMGQVMGFAEPDAGRELKPILRPATPRDLVLRQEWEAKQAEALVICREKAYEMGNLGDVKFHAAQYNYDGSLLTFLYSAEERANLQKLQNALKNTFKTTIEMRQIGPRDVAKLLGGFGACGELRCCSTFLTDFSPISIKMAKMQGISLNPEEITGMCGRLRCCLVYEYEQYVEARKGLPKKGKRIGTPDGIGKVSDVFPLQDMVTVYFEGTGVRPYKREDLIPVDELEALQRKAKEPCTKHGEGESCECGQKPGERNQDKTAPSASKDASAPNKPPREPREPRENRGGEPREGRDGGGNRNRRRPKKDS